MRKFSGDEVNVVGQATVTLCCGEHQCQISVNSEGTPLELLLGTDALGKLGFQVLHHNGNGKLHNLLSMVVMPEESATVVSAKEEAVTIKVLKATKVLGCHCQLARVNVLMPNNIHVTVGRYPAW